MAHIVARATSAGALVCLGAGGCYSAFTPKPRGPMSRRLLVTLSLTLSLAACSAERASTRDAQHADAMATEHAHDDTRPNASAQEPAHEVATREVAYATVNGQPITGYLARPADAGDAVLPGVLLIHEWWGLNDNIRMMARRLAGEGYSVLAVDLYGGRRADTPSDARALVMEVMKNPHSGMDNLRQAAGWLQREAGARRLGVMGWCFGGGWSLHAGLAMPEAVDAVVMYYGQVVTGPAELRGLDAPLLGIFGSKDEGIPLAEVRKMEAALKELGKDVSLRVYEDAGHAFANPSGKNYVPAAAEDAWQHTLAFLAQHLGPTGR
jgi:carboxymethylenebutenolidase